MTFATDSLPEKIYRTPQVRELDQMATQDTGITGYELMCRAGEAACDVLRLRWPSARAIQIFCGAGNNAGDGYVVARLTLKQGYKVVVSAVVAPDKLSGDAARAYADYRDSGGKVEILKVATSAFSADLIIDALLGIGFGRELEGLFKNAVEAINAAQCPVLALDVPTGLHADTVALQMGLKIDIRIIPFRGEYFLLRPNRSYIVNGLIYPVPNPMLPFLGVHFTKRIDGSTEAGPSAVLAFAREGYKKTDFDPHETLGILSHPGFWSVVSSHWKTGIKEQYRSWVKGAFVRSLQNLVPDVEAADLVHPGAGVRAQAIARNGELLQDFMIIQANRSIHVLNAPSPAATACLAIGKHIVQLAQQSFNLRI